MQCLKQFFEKNKIYFSKISLIINLTLLIFNHYYILRIISIMKKIGELIENLSIIIVIYISLLKSQLNIQIYLLYCLIYSLLFIFFVIILEYFNKRNILFNNKKQFTILSSYIFLTINIIIISILFGAMFYEFREDKYKYIFKKNKRFVILIIIISILTLFTLLINIIFFLSYKFFNDENNNNESEEDSINSKSTKESNISNNNSFQEIINDKIYFQNKVIENLTKLKIDSYAQTIY